MKYLPVYVTVTGFVSCVTASLDTVLKPENLHLYAVKSVGHRTLFLSMVSFSFAEFGELISDPTAEARVCNDSEGHWICGVWSLNIATAVSKPVLLFLWSCM